MNYWDEPPKFWSWHMFAALASFFFLAAGLQYLAGAYEADLGQFPDEPSHYVTGLMIHDYLRERPMPAPMQFAKSYYHRYPKVAMGQWPPLFYCVESVWMMLFGVTPASVLLLIAFLSAVCCVTLYWFATRACGPSVGLGATLVFLLLTSTQELNASVMVDIVMTGAILAATGVCGSLLQQPTYRHGLYFGLLAVAAIMTKANALLLAMVPVLAALFTGRLRRLAFQPAVWLPVLIVIAGVGPWYITFSRVVSQTMSMQPGWDFTRLAIEVYSDGMLTTFGWPVLLLAVAGIWTGLVLPLWHRNLPPAAAVLPAMGIACLIFHGLVANGPDIRYILPTLAWLCVAAGTGSLWLAQRLPYSPAVQQAVALGGLLALFGVTGFHLHHKNNLGTQAAVAAIRSLAPARGPVVVLVSGQPDMEGALVAEAAFRDRQRQWIVYRGSKVAASSTWTGRDYHLLQDSPSELKAHIDHVPFHFILLENSEWLPPHQKLLFRLIKEHPADLRLVPGVPNNLLLFQTAHPPGGCVHPLQVNMEHTLGGSISLDTNTCDPVQEK